MANGSVNSRGDVPRLLELWRDGHLDLDRLVTRTYPGLGHLEEGYDDMRKGSNLRGVLVLDD